MNYLEKHIDTATELLYRAQSATPKKALDYLYQAIVAITAAINQLEMPISERKTE